MMPGSKGLNPRELAHRWVKDLGTRPDMSISWDDNPTICEYWVELLRAAHGTIQYWGQK